MERISALMDGELEDFEVAGQLKQLVTDESRLGAWREYHLIGDVLRGECLRGSVFSQAFQAKLAAEPTVLAPRAIAAVPRKAKLYAMSAAASVAGVAAVVWLALGNYAGLPGGQIAQREAAQPVMAGQAATPVAAARPEVSDYLLAHQEYSPANSMRGVASYIRTVGSQEADMSR